MKYLFLFLKKQIFFFTFIFLELIAILLLVNHTAYHKSHIVNSANVVTGLFYSGFSSVSDYFSLVTSNRQLVEENARLKNLGVPQMMEIDSCLLLDTTYLYLPAKVVSNTSRNRNNYIMINRGKKHGIEKEMGLVSPSGVAGIIVDVSNNYATAISILHKNIRISARLKKSGQMVSVVWGGGSYRKGMIEDIPTHLVPMAGDTVVTSGYSFVFPENIMIGLIGKNLVKGGSLNKAEILFSTDFNNLNYVYATRNMAMEEIDSLKINITDE